MRIPIPFAHGTRELTLPEDRVGRILSPGRLPPLADLPRALQAALEAGEARSFFRLLADRTRSGLDPTVAIAVNDHTRPTPLDQVLPTLLDILNARGVPDSRIRIVAALGTHRQMSREEFRLQAGEEVLDRVGFVNPRLGDPSSMVVVGRDPELGEIRINREFAGADMKIAVGTILPHGAVGFSGGAKMIIPGLASREVVERFHVRANTDPENRAGRIDSPIRRRIEEAVGPAGLHLMVNLVTDPSRRICGLTAGHYVRSHRKALPVAEALYGLEFPARSRVLVAGSAPADLDFWQAAKTIFNVQHALQDGGWLVLLTPCPEGIPAEHPRFDRYVGLLPERIEALLGLGEDSKERGSGGESADDRVALAPALALSRFRRRINIAIVSEGLSRRQVRRMGFHRFASLQSALERILQRMPEVPRRVDVVTHGGMSYARVAGRNP